jgi:phospholipid/cholesterol/gamma-HCH transport system ATP-binding protein
MTEPLVRLKGISKSFGIDNKPVLNDVNLDIDRHETIAIIGPSGTGKSTILRIIAGLLAADRGEVYLNGQLREGLLEDSAQDPFRISLVFQQSALFDSLTVEENVGFLLYQHSKLPHHKIRQRVEESLERVGLKDISHLYPAELSGGMRKRVSFARAIMEDPDNPSDSPELILYDEPTAGLDPAVQSCSTYVVVTHQESTIRRTANRVIMLYQGQVQWQGSVADLDRTDNPYVRQFFSASTEGPMKLREWSADFAQTP